MELIENLLQLLTMFVGALLSGISYRKSHRQAYFLLLCFYGCFALGALYWTLYLLLFDTTPRGFYVSEFGWVASLIFLRILQATLSCKGECSFRSRSAWLSPLIGVLYFVFAEYLLWTLGCFWPNTSPDNPTFWCDMLLTLAIFGLLPATRKAVEA